MPTFDTPEPITATIDVVVGDVRITAGATGTTVVDVRPSDTGSDEDRKVAERTRVEYAGDALLVKAPKLRSWLPRSHGGSIDVTIELPAGSHVRGGGAARPTSTPPASSATATIKTGLGQIQLERAAAVNLKTGIGDITVGHVSGHADISAGSGEVRVQRARGQRRRSRTPTATPGSARRTATCASTPPTAASRSRSRTPAWSPSPPTATSGSARSSAARSCSRPRLGDLEVGIREGTAA